MLHNQPPIRRRHRILLTSAAEVKAGAESCPNSKAGVLAGQPPVVDPKPKVGKVSKRREAKSRALVEENALLRSEAEARANEPKVKLTVEYELVGKVSLPERELRKHSAKQIKRIMGSIRTFGLNLPIIVDENGVVVDGVALFKAALDLGYELVPVIRLRHLNRDQLRLYRIGVNKLSEGSTWDEGLLKLEFLELGPIMLAEEIDPEILGFGTAEFDLLTTTELEAPASEDADPELEAVAVSRLGDLWILGGHRLYCGDALASDSYQALMGNERARMVFVDAPYNVPIEGHVSGLGKTTHREFVSGSGEMSEEQFSSFIAAYMARLHAVSLDGAIHYHCMDWRHISQVIVAGEGVYGELKQLVVWKKTNAGMGTFYRSQHELIAVFKVGDAPHVNTFELGQTGRYRTNCWEYAGANSFSKNRSQDLADHPTVKPTAMVMDAIKDVSHQGDIVLDCFAGSGTIILAAEKTHRRARAIELDPLYVDVAIRRWETLTGQTAVLEGDGRTFAEISADRLGEEVCDD